eukprot:COSAG05_NODE_513_length_9084_cov_5.373957_8_plen_145_part_00
MLLMSWLAWHRLCYPRDIPENRAFVKHSLQTTSMKTYLIGYLRLCCPLLSSVRCLISPSTRCRGICQPRMREPRQVRLVEHCSECCGVQGGVVDGAVAWKVDDAIIPSSSCCCSSCGAHAMINVQIDGTTQYQASCISAAVRTD